MSCRSLALLTLAVLAAVAAPVSACFSGLTLIPTAETVGPRVISLEPQIDASVAPAHIESRIFNTQFGFGETLEAGVDFDLSNNVDERVLLNAKYVFLPPIERRPAIAAGVFNVSSGVRTVPYLVCSAQLRGLALHIGGMRTESNNRWFAGLHKPLSQRMCVMADHISGDENYSALGIEYSLSERTAILVGEQFPNGSGDPTLTLHLVVTVDR